MQMRAKPIHEWDLRNRAFAHRVGANWQTGVPLHLTATPEWASSPQGQLLLLHLANHLPRMGPGYRQISVSSSLKLPLHPEIRRWCKDRTLMHALQRRIQGIIPGDHRVHIAEAGSAESGRTLSVWVGQPDEPTSGHDISVVTDGWKVTLLLGFGIRPQQRGDCWAAKRYNPISAQWAAAALCALLYQRHSVGTALDSLYEWTCWPPGLPVAPPAVEDMDIGNIVMIGCGAVGNAFLEVLRTWPGIRGSLTLYDPEVADATNLNRYLLLDQHRVGHAKVDVAWAALANVPGLQVQGFCREITDAELARARRIVLAVDKVAPRVRIQASWPDLLLEAGTGHQWFHVAHCHRSLIRSRGGACQRCIHGKGDELPREDREATAVFVSSLTGAVLARELLLTLRAGPEAVADCNRVNGNAFEPESVESARQQSNPDCDVCREACWV